LAANTKISEERESFKNENGKLQDY
jgi:hypothetical protein